MLEGAGDGGVPGGRRGWDNHGRVFGHGLVHFFVRVMEDGGFRFFLFFFLVFSLFNLVPTPAPRRRFL